MKNKKLKKTLQTQPVWAKKRLLQDDDTDESVCISSGESEIELSDWQEVAGEKFTNMDLKHKGTFILVELKEDLGIPQNMFMFVLFRGHVKRIF